MSYNHTRYTSQNPLVLVRLGSSVVQHCWWGEQDWKTVTHFIHELFKGKN